MASKCILGRYFAPNAINCNGKAHSYNWRGIRQYGSTVQNGPIPISEAKRFITDCMVKLGTPKSHAEELSEVLAAADYRGHFSHGLNRLGKNDDI
jgi:hypothetical protein